MSRLKDMRYNQYTAAFAANLATTTFGMSTAWTSPVTIPLKSDNSPIGIKLNTEEVSWVVSVLLLAAIPGSLVAVYFTDYIGRKHTTLLFALMMLAHWFMVTFTRDFGLLLAGRAFSGVSSVIMLPAVIMYTGEISEEDIRGHLSTYNILLKTFGAVIVLLTGPFVSYTVLGMICAGVTVISIVSFAFMPESPYFWIKVGKPEKARKAIVFLSRKTSAPEFIDERMELIREVVESDMSSKSTYFELLTKKKYRYVLFLMFGIKSLQQFSGNLALEAYTQPIVAAANSGVSPEIASIIIGAIQIPAVCIATWLIDRAGRRILLITSAVFCGVALAGEGVYFLMQDYVRDDVEWLGWLPTSALALYWIMNPMGVLTVPYVLMGELFPTNVKGVACSLMTAYGSFAGFIASKFFEPLSDSIGRYTVFFIFAGICILGALFVFFFLPETKGKNFLQVQAAVKTKSSMMMNIPKDELAAAQEASTAPRAKKVPTTDDD